MYTTDSSIVGYQPIASGWRALLMQHGALPDADTILVAYDQWARAYHLDPNLAIAQACIECAWFTDYKWVQFANPCGLGSTSRDVPGAKFANPNDGIRAQCEHLCAYAYTIAECPVDHAHMLDPRHFMHDGQPLIGFLNGHWAVPGTSYAQDITALANTVPGGVTPPAPPPGGTMRIIVSAGHEHISQIGPEKIGQASADALRTATGALGREAEWTAPWADELVRLLGAAGVDAVRTDAIYHADVYGSDADLLICGHCDGVGGTGHAQWCMIGTVHSGPSTTAADSRADAFAADWQAIYPQESGIAGNGPITTDMLQYYGGWYRGAETPMVLAEHCILGDASGWRADAPTPQQGAAWDFAALAKHFNFTNAPQPPAPPPAQSYVVDGHDIGPGFYALYQSVSTENDARMRLFGLC
ncbi:MAG TPA: hypothetical protein VIG44_04680, partial [Thermomicrobiales bacterium]